MKVICTGFNPLFTHHRKLIIGEVYDGYKKETSYAIYKNKIRIGDYDEKWFTPLKEWRDKQIDDILEN